METTASGGNAGYIRKRRKKNRSEDGVTSLIVKGATMEGPKMELRKSTEAWILDLGDERAPTRCTAAYELGKIGDNQAVEHLATVLKDCYFSVRLCAAEALGLIGNREAVGPLIKALGDDDRVFREAVLSALAKITNEFFSTPKEWTDWFRRGNERPEFP